MSLSTTTDLSSISIISGETGTVLNFESFASFCEYVSARELFSTADTVALTTSVGKKFLETHLGYLTDDGSFVTAVHPEEDFDKLENYLYGTDVVVGTEEFNTPLRAFFRAAVPNGHTRSLLLHDFMEKGYATVNGRFVRDTNLPPEALPRYRQKSL